jgi:xylulokinase
VVMLPYLDGERTPNLPHASGSIRGLRHDTTPQQILMAAYEGAVASLLVAFDAIGEAVGGLDPDAPLVLVGGGARGQTWREVVSRFTGRAIQVPDAGELVAIGAAVQAAAILRGEEPGTVAARWGGATGTMLDPVPVDHDRLDRVRAAVDTLVLEQGVRAVT